MNIDSRPPTTHFSKFILVLLLCLHLGQGNRPPRFLINGQTEIVLRLKEGPETPVGSLIYKLRAADPDGDNLSFGVRAEPGSEVIRVEKISANEADLYLNQELDREARDEYALVLTLTDGRLGQGNFVTQSLLVLVEDVNDNTPIFLSQQLSISVREDAAPGVIASLEARDADEGAYGQVVYQLQDPDSLFSVSTAGGKAIVRLTKALDYETQTLHQLKVLAVDRAKQGRVNTGTATLLVQVEDVEDQPPEFVRVTSVARVPENAPIGTPILQVTAIDGDRGVNNPIRYSLSDGISEIFTVGETSGVLLTKRSLDREALLASSGTYILQITATEHGGGVVPPPATSTDVTVIVTDVNDEAPRFKSGYYECEIAENAPVNTPLTWLGTSTPEVFDHDQGVNGTFLLYVKGAPDTFEITPTQAINDATFTIRVKNSTALDFERLKTINFTLVAKEVVKHQPKFSEVPVIVHIRDRNDNYPEFTKSVYEVFVPENCNAGTTVAWVQALDDDSGTFGTMGIRYTNLAGSAQHLLNLHPVSGVITVKTAGGPSWDREQVARQYLTVEARDALGHGNRNTVQLIVNIEDVNDNAPVFVQNRYEARLLENRAEFEQALRVEARDADLTGTDNSRLEYSLAGELSYNFSIEPRTGVVRPSGPIDFELLEQSSLEGVRELGLTIRARDFGTPSLFTDAPLAIYVQDVNDHAPVFEYLFYNSSVPETLPAGSSVLQVKARDFDGSAPNNKIVYRIQDGAADKFIIEPDSGTISIARGASLDPDLVQPRKTQYTLTVFALDGAPGQDQLQATVSVNISIMDVNNKLPVFDEVPEAIVPENTPVGSTIARVFARDLDSTARLLYKISSTQCSARNEHGVVLKPSEFHCLEHFNLHSSSGVLTVTKQLDREVVEHVLIPISVEDTGSDTGPQIATSTITVLIQDINDNSPRFQLPFYKFAITENSKNGALIGSVRADDPDKNKTVTYTLDSRFQSTELIHLDPESGDLVVANKIDHEAQTWLNFTVKASDAGAPVRSSRVEVFIQVLDENDNSPVFLPEPRTLLVSEDIEVGVEVGRIVAQDSDSGEFGKITYLIDRLSSDGKFALDSETGVLKVAQRLDREAKQQYLLVIEAWDNYQFGFNAGESRNAFKHLNVTIGDVNDNPPQLQLPGQCVNITEFHEPGQIVLSFHASDADDPKSSNGQVIIDISDGNQRGFFALQQIGDWSAELRTTQALRGEHGNYTLVIRAQDLGSPSHLIEEPLHVCVIDFNDHAPVFVTPPHNSTLRVPENATIGSALVKILARDQDVGSNGLVRYRLRSDPAGHFKSFSLQPASGILELRLPLNRTRQRIYDIRIEAYDLGIPSLSSDLDLTVYITNINDYQPQFLTNEHTVAFTENAPPGQERRRLPDTIARDQLEFDGAPNPVCYFLVAGNSDGLFELDARAHDLTLTGPLDRESQASHLLLVKATETCGEVPQNQSFFDPADDTLLKILVEVVDVNDNPPRFLHSIFTGGVSTATSFGTTFMTIKAEDLDAGPNAVVSYHLVGTIQMTLTEGLDSLKQEPFLVDVESGDIALNFDPQQGMKGYFDFMVLANDTGGLFDTARVFIYLLREDQRVRFVLRQQAPELRDRIEAFREILGNVTGAIVNVDEFKVHANHDGTIDKTRTDLYLHLVDRRDHSIIEVDEVLRLVDQNTERLDGLFKDFNVLDTQPGGSFALRAVKGSSLTFWLTAASLFLLLLLFLCLALCINQRQTYHRKLKAATATAYAHADSGVDGGLSVLSGRVPNTNKHSMEGSNPIWLQAYENEWYKANDEFSQNSEHDSLDENVVSEELGCSLQQNNLRNQNLYQTLPPLRPRKSLETTEL